MTRETELQLLNEVMQDLTQNTTSVRYTYQEGELKAGTDANISFINKQGKSYFVTYIPYDYDGNKIDLRIRKRLAGEFINTYSIQFLQTEYEKAIDLKNKKLDKLKIDYEHLKALLDKFNMFDKAELKAYAQYPVIKLESSWKDFECRHKTVNKQYEVLKLENGYRIQEAYNRLDGSNFNSIDELLVYCSSLVTEIEKSKQEAALRLQEQAKKEERENNIRNLCWNIARDKDKAYIVKSKNTYTVYRRGMRYSMRGQGKYYSANYDKLESDMINGKITHYIKVDSDFKREDIDLKEIDFIAI